MSTVGIVTAAQAGRERKSEYSLLSPRIVEPEPLVQVGSPEQRCEQLAEEGQEQPSYLHLGVYSQCSVLLVDGNMQNSTSLFIQIQTDPSGEVSSFRLKFNTEGTEVQRLVVQGLKSLKRFEGLGGADDRLFQSLGSKINQWQSFRLIWGHYLLEMDQELSDRNRFNLIARSLRATNAS